MVETNINITPGSGGPNVDLMQVENGNVRQVIVIGDATTSTKFAPVDATKGLTTQAYQVPADLCVSITGAAAAGVTATLSAVINQFHYITFIEITKYFTATNAASATPLLITTTNLPGSLTYSMGQPLGTIGTTDRVIENPSVPIKALLAGTPTTIVCPATAGIIWRINVHYYTAP